MLVTDFDVLGDRRVQSSGAALCQGLLVLAVSPAAILVVSLVCWQAGVVLNWNILPHCPVN